MCRLFDEIHVLDALAEVALVHRFAAHCLIDALQLREREQLRQEVEAYRFVRDGVAHDAPCLLYHLAMVGEHFGKLVDIHPFHAVEFLLCRVVVGNVYHGIVCH